MAVAEADLLSVSTVSVLHFLATDFQVTYFETCATCQDFQIKNNVVDVNSLVCKS